MRIRNSGVIGLVAATLLASVLLSGCELREGPEQEYGKYGLNSKEKLMELPKELSGQGVRKF
jgi:hypothetical protein